MESNENKSLTVEQKFAKAMLKLRTLRPFYSAVYEVMDKKETNMLPTVAVTTNELIYNKEFVQDTGFTDFLFILLHEIGHIALMHVARMENRDQTLWNVAADLYVNASLAEEFGLEPGKTIEVNGVELSMPTNLLYCSSIDLDNDYVEKIYEELEKQAKKNGYMQSKQMKLSSSPIQSNQNDQGQGQNNQGQGDQGQQGDQGSQNNQGQQGYGQNMPNQRKTSPIGKPVGGKYNFQYKGSKETSSFGSSSRHSVFNMGIDPEDQFDLVNTGEDQSIKNQKAEKIVSDAVVRVEMNSSNIGDGTQSLMATVKKMMKSQLDWKKLLRRYLISATTKDSSFLRPDKRMYYQKSIYPGQMSDESNSIKGVKVCIDTSGSISDDDIAYFCGQVYDLVKQFKIEAELIYWDCDIQSTGEFTGYKEFERVSVMGRGGTDPRVVFSYFDSKKCKIKPVVTLMFTDGYFSTEGITPKQRRKYKDTIWIMTREHDRNFEPPFGKKAIAKFS